MRRCHQCGLSIGKRASYCPVCGARADPEADLPSPPIASASLCSLCGHPGASVDVDSFRLCLRCYGELEPLINLGPPSHTRGSLPAAGNGDELAAARTVEAVYTALPGACPACAAMHGHTTANLVEASAWIPNAHCTSFGGCRCEVSFVEASLVPEELSEFLAYAVKNGLLALPPAVQAFHAERRREDSAQLSSKHRGNAVSQQLLSAALELMRKARDLEKADASRAAQLYRQAVVQLLELSDDPLDSPVVRSRLLLAFDRLSIVLKRCGLQGEALEEIDSAAYLGLLDCTDRGIKTHREALSRRRRSLRQTLTN